MTDSCVLPDFNRRQAAQFVQQLWNLDGAIKQLDGERDLNFLISNEGGKFVFKIANADESPTMLECQHQVFQCLADAQVFPKVATAIASVHGRLIETLRSEQGDEHVCRVLPFIEGRLLSQVKTLRPALLEDLGRRLALLDQALDSFSHAALERALLWKMEDALAILEAYKSLLANPKQRALVEHFETSFREQVAPSQHDLRRTVIHNDANRGNVLVDEDELQVISIIDFGDMVNSWLVVEPAIAATYAMLDQSDPLEKAHSVVRGYHQVVPLLETEISLIFDLICMRLCMSVCICAHQRRLEPDNYYLSSDEPAVWALLETLRKLDANDVRGSMLSACGFN